MTLTVTRQNQTSGLRVWIAAVALALLASSCATSQATDTARSEAPLQLTFAGFPGHGFDERIVEWERDHPGVEVQIIERDFEDHHVELLDALDSQDAPDVATVEVALGPTFAERSDDLVDLRSFGADDLEDRYLDWRWSQGVVGDGKVTGIPTDLGGLAVAYRVDLFAEAGLPTDRDEVAALWPTWQDFLATGERFVAASERAFMDDPANIMSAMLNQGALQFYDHDGEFIGATNPLVQKAWTFAADAQQASLTTGYLSFTEEWTTGMIDGEYAVLLAPAWMMSFIQGQAPGTAGLWDIASVPGGGGNWGGSQLVIPAGSDEPELAWDLITYLLSPQGQLQTFTLHGNFPSIPELYDEPAIIDSRKEFFNDAPVGEIYVESARALNPAILGRHQQTAIQVLGNGLEVLSEGDASRDEVWATILELFAILEDDDADLTLEANRAYFGLPPEE